MRDACHCPVHSRGGNGGENGDASLSERFDALKHPLPLRVLPRPKKAEGERFVNFFLGHFLGRITVTLHLTPSGPLHGKLSRMNISILIRSCASTNGTLSAFAINTRTALRTSWPASWLMMASMLLRIRARLEPSVFDDSTFYTSSKTQTHSRHCLMQNRPNQCLIGHALAHGHGFQSQ